jgi:HEAT repeat protein
MNITRSRINIAGVLLVLLESVLLTAVQKEDVQVEGGSEVAKLLAALEDEKYTYTRSGIIPLVEEIGDKEPTSFLVEQLQAESRRRRCKAALLLELLGDRRGVPAIIKELNDTSFRPYDDMEFKSDNRQLVNRQIVQDRYYAALLLGILGDKRAVPALIEVTRDETIDYQAAMSLGQIGDKRAIPALHDMLERCSNKPFPCLFAGYGLAMLGDKEGLKVVIDTLNDHQAHWTIRRHAIEALGKLRDKEAMPYLITALKDEHPNIRVSAAKALGEIGDVSALPALKEALEDKTETKVNAPITVSEAAAKAIAQIEGKAKHVKERIHTEEQKDSREHSEHNVIIPGLRVGDYRLGMSKDDVLKKLGKPKMIFHSGERYTLENLPRKYFMVFDDISFGIVDDSVEGIGVLSPLYKFANGLGVGDSEQKIKQAFGDDFHLKETEGKDFLTYKDKGLQFEIHKKNRTVMEIGVSHKISRGHGRSLAKPIKSVKPYDDVRWKDLSKLDLSRDTQLIHTLTFNKLTVWPEQTKMPPGGDPNKILTDALNPGLGVRQLHQQGITGKGVNVAIIDQPTYLVHPEFAGKIVAYHDTGCETDESSMHGPLVASLLVGTNCGTAPGARVYYAAAPSWKTDAAYYAKGLDWIIAQNEKLPEGEKIRVVSVSASPNQSSWENRKMWDEACARAEADGIMILDCTDSHRRGFIGRCWYNARVPESVSACTPGTPRDEIKIKHFGSDSIFVPSAPRTAAEDGAVPGYQYARLGGLSRAIPYCTGVLAMGWQVNPELSPEQMRELLFKSAYTNKNRAKIISPRKFIRLVRNAKATQIKNSH